MAVDHIRYDLLTQDAMRGVVRRVLRDAAAKGLAGEHHFFISFATRAPGVKLSPRLHAQYAEEMTIVLQHQFWDLTVADESFEVGLSFNGIPERLTVPFAAIKGFFDPSVNFGLQFAESAAGSAEQSATQPAPSRVEAAATVDNEKSQPASEGARKTVPAPAETVAPVTETPGKPAGGAEVVRLDRFRKK
jgi:uncharacterized protein